MTMKIYLSGAIGETLYREIATTLLGERFEIVDPIAINDSKVLTYQEIVEKDKLLIDGCDVLFVYIRTPSYGTVMEILYAWERKIPVLVITDGDQADQIWLKYHTTKFFTTFKEAENYLDDMKRNKIADVGT